jgi:hypothetical protein
MAIDSQKKLGTIASYKDDRDGAVLISHPVIAIVKSNVDPTRNGQVWVYIENYGGIDPNDAKNWLPVRYMSPYYGTSSDMDSKKNIDRTGEGSFTNNPHSYGMWTGSPSVGSRVICIFINGRSDMGYYIGYAPSIGSHSMVPAIASSSNVVPNDTEAENYAGATRLPTAEVNLGNTGKRNSRTINSDPKPIHSYQASILSNQGLVRDNIRGTIGSSSSRETPSNVVGISTPGRPIYEGGYNSKTIQDAIKTGDTSKLKQIGSLGGHSIVMDDGQLTGEDQLVRIRTGAGHQIMLSDSGQSVFIIHSNGHSWIELGKEGTVDIYAANSFNVRTVGDINFHADRDINMHAKRNLNLFGDSVKIDSDQSIGVYAEKDILSQSGGKYSVKSGSTLSIESQGNSNYKSGGINYIRGKKIHLNTGDGPAADTVPKASFKNHKDTSYSEKVGWIQPSPNPLLSIVTRAPTHQPWDGANKGVDVEIKTVAAPGQEPSEDVKATNNTAPEAPSTPTTPEAVQTVPAAAAVKAGSETLIDGSTMKAAVSQQAAINTTLSEADKAAQGIAPGPGGVSIRQLEGNITKVGTSDFIADKMKAGMSFAESAGKTLMIGAEGAKTAEQFATNAKSQVTTIASSMQKSATELIIKGVISGKEATTQVTGIVMAAANFGVSTVANLIKNPAKAISAVVTGTITGLADKTIAVKNMISGGNFAAGIGDKLMSGLKGVASSISELGTAAAAGVAGLTEKLQGVAKKAFAAVESSFGKLKAGIPNPLGGLKQAKELSQAESNIAKLNAASEEVTQAEENLREAKKLARLAGEQADNSSIQQAESLLAQAKQKSAKLSAEIVVGTSDASTETAIPKTGINSLPGGLGAFAAQISNVKNNALSTLKSAAAKITDLTGKR